MNEKHAFARIERCLAREDPELAQRINAINSQFTDRADERFTAQTDERLLDHTDGPAADRAAEEHLADQPEDGGERSWTTVIAVVLTAVAILGLLLTAILSAPGGNQQPPQPHGLAPPAAVDVNGEQTWSDMP
ncbi:hypothetical protein [Streptomyces sp. UG1]|uniref:hypothetical protein n=1 Tax=Streptomyces sp. UG1 TaxID=3417652 RepID=UPI003CE9E493